MKRICTLLTAVSFVISGFTQEIVTDYDGNEYTTVSIGTQIWLKENIRSLHYSDGISIPEVVAYNYDNSLALKYGRLYTWDATMKNSNEIMTQGVCPTGWHVPSAIEWSTLESYLGGSSVAGGKMKATTDWKEPNTGSDNSSGFTAYPGGEYDANEYMSFILFEEYAVFWTSTEISSTKAREKYLAYNSAACSIYDWYKNMKYSVRCIKNTTTDLAENSLNGINIYPTLVNDILNITNSMGHISNIELQVVSMMGKVIVDKTISSDYETIDVGNLPAGIYLVKIQYGNQILAKKIVKVNQ